MGAVALVIVLAIIFSQRSRRRPNAPTSVTVYALLQIYVRAFFLLAFLILIGLREWELGAAELIVLPLPWIVMERIILPLGLPRTAYCFAHILWPIGSFNETGANALLCAARAYAHRPVPPQRLAWLERKLARARVVRGTGLVAAALVHARCGNRHLARGLCVIADSLPGSHIPRSTRALARDWLVADAARDGRWRMVIRLGRRPKANMRWSYFMARAGERLVADPKACAGWQLCFFWVLAPRRQYTFPLLRRALSVPRRRREDAVQTRTRDLASALAELAAQLRRPYAGEGALACAVDAVDNHLEAAPTQALIERRLLATGGRGGGDSVARVRQVLIEVVAPFIEADPSLRRGGTGPTLTAASERIRSRLFRDVEAQCRDYSDRRAHEQALDPMAEWEAWAQLRETAERLLELDPAGENALFQIMYVPVCNFGVFQQNKCKRPVIAHDMYTWLYRYAGSDASALQLLSQNARASRT